MWLGEGRGVGGEGGETRRGQSQVWPEANYKRFACRGGRGIKRATTGKSRQRSASSFSLPLSPSLALDFPISPTSSCRTICMRYKSHPQETLSKKEAIEEEEGAEEGPEKKV